MHDSYDLKEHVRSRMKRGTELVRPLCVSRPACTAAMCYSVNSGAEFNPHVSDLRIHRPLSERG